MCDECFDQKSGILILYNKIGMWPSGGGKNYILSTEWHGWVKFQGFWLWGHTLCIIIVAVYPSYKGF
jgi:hypothetical protein